MNTLNICHSETIDPGGTTGLDRGLDGARDWELNMGLGLGPDMDELDAALREEAELAMCMTCYGTGETSTMMLEHSVAGLTTCPDCEGAGVIRPSRPSLRQEAVLVDVAGWLIVDLPMPGVVARDLDVSIDGNSVVIKALPRIDAPETPVRIGRDSKAAVLERTLALPRALDSTRLNGLQATLAAGVLRLVLPLIPNSDQNARHNTMKTINTTEAVGSRRS